MIDTRTPDRITSIRHLNDRLRSRGEGGRTVLSRGIAALGADELVVVLRAVAAFASFTPANDPHGEHDCAILEAAAHRILWKIDYYDPDLRFLSPDPADPEVTRRVLTIMLAEEY
ncbi:DUF3768 domain-containing protein [Devosia sp.]|uniref:DUF3768 domain-containing protein n=1 Tax=Devosia sp. TaxID=1871048 RepID=UPI002B0003DC|nr:DUF3768 domain-containing protein [Devosia sp.]